MNTCIKAFTLAALAAAFAASACVAADSVAGTWKTQFDSQIGVQKYTYEFKVDGDKLTGKAIGVRDMGTNEVTLTEGKVNGDEISFVEPLQFGDNELRIEYKGKVSGDEIKFTRKVGDVATETFVAKRVKESEAKSVTKAGAETNAPPAKPQP